MSLVISLGLGLGELHDAASAAALGLVHQEDEQQDDERERQQRRQERAEEAGLRDRRVVVLDGAGLPLLLDRGEELLLLAVDVLRDDLVAVLAVALVEGRLDLEVGAVELDLVDLPSVVDVGGDLEVLTSS